MTLVFEAELKGLGAWPTFAIFGVITAISLVFIYAEVPETKGLSLEQIEALYQGRSRSSILRPVLSSSGTTAGVEEPLLSDVVDERRTPSPKDSEGTISV